MINLDEINSEIEALEGQPMNYATIQKLSWLYIVRDHNTSAVSDSIPESDKSEFLCACSCKPLPDVMRIMDELMTALMTIYPRLYEAVLAKL